VIEFSTSFGKFHLPIKASLPEHIIEFSDFIDFGLCPVRETAKKVFVMKNTGKLNTYFEYEIREPFSVYPSNGSLAPGTSCNITIDFKPKSACVLTAVLVCTFGTYVYGK
jgi:cilia- and flagella-associated protein 65